MDKQNSLHSIISYWHYNRDGVIQDLISKIPRSQDPRNLDPENVDPRNVDPGNLDLRNLLGVQKKKL